MREAGRRAGCQTSSTKLRMQNLLLACTTCWHGWLHAPAVPGLGLSLKSENFRVAMKFRLGMALIDEGSLCPATSKSGQVCGAEMDVFGDHALCCHHGTSRVFRHNQVRDILGHAAKAAGLSAVVIEKKNQISGSKKKPGDITVQQYHRGFSSTAFDVTVTHPLQKKYIEVANGEAGVAAQAAHNRKLEKTLEDCKKEGLHFVPLAWESMAALLRRCTQPFASGRTSKLRGEATLWRSFARICTRKCLAAYRATWRRRFSTVCPSARALVLSKHLGVMDAFVLCMCTCCVCV